MSRASPVNMSSTPEEIYRHYSELYDKRDRQMRQYGTEMYARKLDKQSLMIVVQSQINDNKERRWSMDQIVRNTVSRETSRLSVKQTRTLIQRFQTEDVDLPEEWYTEAGDLCIPSFNEIRAMSQTHQLDFAWDEMSQSYQEWKQEGERLNAAGKLPPEYDTPAKYAKHLVSQYYWGSK